MYYMASSVLKLRIPAGNKKSLISWSLHPTSYFHYKKHKWTAGDKMMSAKNERKLRLRRGKGVEENVVGALGR